MYEVRISNPKTHHRGMLVETLDRLEDSNLLKHCEKEVRDGQEFYVSVCKEASKSYGKRLGYWLVADEVR